MFGSTSIRIDISSPRPCCFACQDLAIRILGIVLGSEERQLLFQFVGVCFPSVYFVSSFLKGFFGGVQLCPHPTILGRVFCGFTFPVDIIMSDRLKERGVCSGRSICGLGAKRARLLST